VSETPKNVSLDATLRAWPDVEKTTTDWENSAQRIEARLDSGDRGETAAYLSDEKLFAAPLGQIEGEGHNSAAPGKPAETRESKGETMTMPADRERDRRSLQDLAKLAATGMTPPPPSVQAPFAPHSSAPSVPGSVQRPGNEARNDDSGIVDLAMAAQSDPHGAVRAQSTPLANAGLFDDEPASVRPPMSAPVSDSRSPAGAAAQLQQPAPSIPPFASATASMPSPAAVPSAPPSAVSFESGPVSAVQSSAQRPVAAPANAKKGNGRVVALLLGGLVAASAVAAGGFFFMKHRAQATPVASQATTATPIVAAAPQAKPAEVIAAPEPSLDPNALPTATPDTKVAAAPKAPAKGGAHVVAKAEKPAAKDEAAKLSAKDLPTTAAGPEGDLGKAMGQAVGADGKPVQATPAAGSNGPQFAAGTVPQKPSQGAVTGAIGAVLPGARACLGPDDPVSRASITFTSAGSVQNVSVSGGAAGKPAEACIKSALGNAKIAPFAEPSYTANITVRH
jgi:hypothetical protein